ncbi:hypothetical protein GW17_00008649 [Ensete ventricosum]|nr:hypothetical protein GW17_00008649 [Ensete ventricosum]
MASSEASAKGSSRGRGDTLSSGCSELHDGVPVMGSDTEGSLGLSGGAVGGKGEFRPRSPLAGRRSWVLCELLGFRFGFDFVMVLVPDSVDALYTELWHACAGPLVTIPRVGERVFYFPQGHMEQVRLESSVFAGIPPKIWDASEYPLLAIAVQQPPSQELVAKDLHRVEWRFRHIFRDKRFIFSYIQSQYAPGCPCYSMACCQHWNHVYCLLQTTVRWDEASSIPRPDRVSPWKIEPAQSPPPPNPVPMPRPKRPRTTAFPSSPDSSVLTKEDFAQMPIMWLTHDEEKNDVSTQKILGSESWMHIKRQEPMYTDMLSGFQPSGDSSGFHTPFLEQASGDKNLLKPHFRDQEVKHNCSPGLWSLMPSNSNLNMGECSLKMTAHVGELSFQKVGSCIYGTQGGHSELKGLGGDQHSSDWLGCSLPDSRTDNVPQHRGMTLQPLVPSQNDVAKYKANNSGCKLFGFHLNSKPVASESVVRQSNSAEILMPQSHLATALPQPQGLEAAKHSESCIAAKLVSTTLTNGDTEKLIQVCPQASKDVQNKMQGGSTRSCTKVHKQGIALGRSVDLTKFNGYEELVAELDHMFEFEGALIAPNKNWLVVYTDNEGDMMLVGDDPWK